MRKIEGVLYRIGNAATGCYEVVECINEEELIKYVANASKSRLITSVVRLDVYSNTVRTPKVAVHTNPLYKQLKKGHN